MEKQFNKSFEAKKEIVPQDALNNFIYDIQEYDKQHSAGSWLGRGLAGMLMKEWEGENEEGGGLQKLHEDIQKNLTLDDIYNRHAKSLNKLGIDIESPNKDGDIDENEKRVSGTLMTQQGISLLTGAVQVSYKNSFQSFSYTPPLLVLDAKYAGTSLWVAKEKSLDTSIRDFSFATLILGYQNCPPLQKI